LPAGRFPKIAQPLGPVWPLNDPAPVPDSPTPGIPTFCASSIATARLPLLGETDPFGGATMLEAITGGRLPMLGQVTVELILM
jgi:hypothetical protein